MSVKYLTPLDVLIQNHICMLPCGSLSDQPFTGWTIDDLSPYSNYLLNHQPIDRFFRGFIFNGVSVRAKHYIYPLYVGFGEPANIKDWTLWTDALFYQNLNLHALSQSTIHVPLDVWISIPYPHPFQTQFGKIDGTLLNFEWEEHRLVAMQWWIDEFLKRWQQATEWHDKLTLKGFVWQREAIDANDESLAIRINAYIKQKGFLSMWLPNYGSYGVLNCRKLGFDITAVNPNYYGNTSHNYKWIRHTCNFAKTYQLGIQIIYGKGIIFNNTHLLDYLNLGLPEHYHYMNQAVLVYQFPNQTMREIYEHYPENYIRLYTFTKGLYSKVRYQTMPY